MAQIRIIERETEDYALKQPVMLRVEIKTGNVIIDRRDEFNIVNLNNLNNGGSSNGQR